MAHGKPQRHKLEQFLMRRLVDGMAGWAAYHQASKARRHVSEHDFYQHVESIATGRDWHVSQQHPLVGDGRPGAPSTVDFVFSRKAGDTNSRRGLAFVEVKFLRGTNPTQDLNELHKDIEKLRRITPADFKNNRRILECGPPAKFLLVFAQEGALESIGSCRSRTNPAMSKMIRKARNRKQRNIYHASLGTYLSTDLEWVVFAIGEPSWPHLV